MIPRIVHAIWVPKHPGEQIPEKGNWSHTWYEHLPGYDIRIYGSEALSSGRLTREAISRGKIVTAAQYGLWKRLYEHGGISMDLDIMLVRPLDDLLDAPFFIGIERSSGLFYLNCGIIGAEPKHPFVGAVLERMETMDYPDEGFEVALGPRVWTDVGRERGWNGRNEDQVLPAGERILSTDRFHPIAWDEQFTEDAITERTYAVHRFAFTWNPKQVGVVVPCFEQAEFLDDCLSSIARQTIAPGDVVVVDDGSVRDKHRIAEICAAHDVTLIRHERNRRLPAARNTGVRATTTPYVVCVDADDMLDPRFIQTLAGLDDIAAPSLLTFGAREGMFWGSDVPHPTVEHFVVRNRIPNASVFKREVFDVIGGFDEKMTDGYEDWDLWVRATHAGASVTALMTPLLRYRTHPHGRMAPCSMEHARKHHDTIMRYLTAKWRAMGIDVPDEVVATRRTYVNGRLIRRGDRVPIDVARAYSL